MELDEYETMFKIESGYWWYAGLHSLVRNCLDEKISGASLILDAGCGTGRLMEILGDGKVIGFDLSGTAIHFSRKRSLASLAIASITHIPFKRDAFNAVVSMDVLCQIPSPGDIKCMKELYNILKPGGVLMLNLPAYNFIKGDHDRAIHLKQRYGRSELKKTLIEAGFVIDMITYRNAFLFPLILSVRLFQKLFPKSGTPESDLKPLPALVNSILTEILLFENRLIAAGIRFPFGLSIFCVASKAQTSQIQRGA